MLSRRCQFDKEPIKHAYAFANTNANNPTNNEAYIIATDNISFDDTNFFANHSWLTHEKSNSLSYNVAIRIAIN
jgi:hypothetical protein